MAKRLGLGLVLILLSIPQAATSADAYLTWEAAHPDPAAEIADLIAKTAVLAGATSISQDRDPGATPIVHDVAGAIPAIIDCARVCP